MGDESWILILVVSPLASQVPAADATVTADGPVTTKSLPLAAIDEQRIGPPNINFNEFGEQATGTMLSIGTGNAGGIVNVVKSPTATYLLQSPRSVLPSLPVCICNW